MTLEIATPQFEREPGYPLPASPPVDREAFEGLCELDEKALRELGLRPCGILVPKRDSKKT